MSMPRTRFMRCEDIALWRVRRKAQGLGVRPLRLHDARHTFATLALASRKSVPWAQSQLGHKNPAVTLRVDALASRLYARASQVLAVSA